MRLWGAISPCAIGLALAMAMSLSPAAFAVPVGHSSVDSLESLIASSAANPDRPVMIELGYDWCEGCRNFSSRVAGIPADGHPHVAGARWVSVSARSSYSGASDEEADRQSEALHAFCTRRGLDCRAIPLLLTVRGGTITQSRSSVATMSADALEAYTPASTGGASPRPRPRPTRRADLPSPARPSPSPAPSPTPDLDDPERPNDLEAREHRGDYEDDIMPILLAVEPFRPATPAPPSGCTSGAARTAFESGFGTALAGKRFSAAFSMRLSRPEGSPGAREFNRYYNRHINRRDRASCQAQLSGPPDSAALQCCQQGYMAGIPLLYQFILTSASRPLTTHQQATSSSGVSSPRDEHCRRDFLAGETQAMRLCDDPSVAGNCAAPEESIRYLGCYQLGLMLSASKCSTGSKISDFIRRNFPAIASDRTYSTNTDMRIITERPSPGGGGAN